MTQAIRIVVADDHPLFLDGLVATLAADSELEVVGVALDAAAAVKAVGEHMPDLALLDVAMPGGGLEAARQIAAAFPTTRTVILTCRTRWSRSSDDASRLAPTAATPMPPPSPTTSIGSSRTSPCGTP